MIKKLTKDKNIQIAVDSLESVKAGVENPITVLHDLLCSTYCERFCGTKEGMDGLMWATNRDCR